MAENKNIESQYASLPEKYQRELWLSLTARARNGNYAGHDIELLKTKMPSEVLASAEKLWASKEDFHARTPEQIMSAAAHEQALQKLVDKFSITSAAEGHGLPPQQQSRSGRSV